MDEFDSDQAPLQCDESELPDLIEKLLERARAGEVINGAIRMVMQDGTVREIAFSESDEEKALALEHLREHVRRSMH